MKTIAVDFDGTIVEHAYPAIGKERPFAVATLKRLQEEGNLLILWTSRTGDLLDEAVAWCRERGLVFWAVNAECPDEDPEHPLRRKLVADYYIDDRNLGGLPDWGVIYALVNGETRPVYDYVMPPVKKTGGLKNLLGR